MNIRDIGTCPTCQNLFCEKPKMITINPMGGCSEWSTPENDELKASIKTETVPKVEE